MNDDQGIQGARETLARETAKKILNQSWLSSVAPIIEEALDTALQQERERLRQVIESLRWTGRSNERYRQALDDVLDLLRTQP